MESFGGVDLCAKRCVFLVCNLLSPRGARKMAAFPQMGESLGSGKKKTAVREDAFTIPDDFMDDFDLDAPPRPPPPVQSKPARPPPPSDEDNFPPPPPGEMEEDSKLGTEIDNLTKILVKNMEHAGEEGFFGECTVFVVCAR